MRVAILSDIHGNLTAFEAVLADIRQMAPDLVMHGGDLADAGSSPIEIVDQIRDLGWAGVMGNTDEMLVRPESLEEFARTSSAPAVLWDKLRQMADATRAVLSPERITWLGSLRQTLTTDEFGLTHGTPESAWRTLTGAAADSDLEAAYGPLDRSTVVFGHTHRPFKRELSGGKLRTLVNAGSVGLPYDGDQRASYALLDDGKPVIRRVDYNVQRELQALAGCKRPGTDWTALMLRTSSPQMPR